MLEEEGIEVELTRELAAAVGAVLARSGEDEGASEFL